ncbi:restriction endonuclease [Bradyrhizobium sp. 2S1]|uniref:restriction endonuclease n=1 Tax=Bradyrhizobium sp. 2S1 TaxID=1404429 RepID=UPI0015887738|nr:restriction endonuclease [Bradyrhizobium sp. 2S1]MCK7665000.1 restriction endonuclease [Bradyrhizobium sp. 2S1]MCK7665299.1 restriction endonuclease [Bradyrhizobium sp. 2S1]
MNEQSDCGPACVAVQQEAPLSRAPATETDTGLDVGDVRYIKLGEKGKWAAQAIKEGTIPFGYRQIDHEACARGDWEIVRSQLQAMGRSAAGISQGLRELKDFYDLPADTMWVTFADGHVWWAFAEDGVLPVDSAEESDPARYRRTRAGWRNTDLHGLPLSVRTLSSALTSTGNYQMTICSIRRADYLLRRIRAEADPLRQEAERILSESRKVALRLIERLDWRDFETLVDLIFARGGWQRTSLLGGEQADVDLLLTQPVTEETAWVQVKSRSRQAEFDDYLDRFIREGRFDRLFYVYHTATSPITTSARNVHIWSAERVAKAVIDLGLLGWLSDRTI